MIKKYLKLIEYLYYFFLITLFIIYLFPGSLIGYFMYGNLNKQPNLIDSQIGSSINHFFYFFFLTSLAAIVNFKKKKLNIYFFYILILSVFLEALHYIIPGRAFQFYDLLANVMGVLIVFFIIKIIKIIK
tara:strand:- start:163 stop:552 length:390 start_codon:yes stop_codon:yes gene_type:complete